MFISRLSIINFKNYLSQSFTFDRKVNAIAGLNGAGKTNLMDAIYYLCMTKSYFNGFDFQNINHKMEFFRLDGDFVSGDEPLNVTCKVVKGKKKIFEVNDEIVPKLSSHIGTINVIFIAPDDNIIILGGSEERRKFIDNTISQVDPVYLQDLLQYNKTLKQRNALLKRFGIHGGFDRDLLHSFNDRLIRFGHPVYEKRKQLFEQLGKDLNDFYNQLSGQKETINIVYESRLHNASLGELLLASEERDRVLQRSTCGIHKDDLKFVMNDFQVKKFSSQGQQKSFLLALKFGQFLHISRTKKQPPILLIDDIFDKLDTERIGNLLRLVSQPPFGQVIMSDTDRTRLKKIFSKISADIRIFDI